MKREFLKALELPEEVVDKIMAEHGATLNATKQDLETAQTTLENLKGEIKTRDQQLKDLESKAGDNENMRQTIEQLRTTNQEAQDRLKTELEKQKLSYELDKALILSKARNPRAVQALLDRDVIKIGDDGQVVGLAEQLEKIKETDAYLFETEPQPEPPAPPAPHEYVPGRAGQPSNQPKSIDPYEAGRLKALERHAPKVDQTNTGEVKQS